MHSLTILSNLGWEEPKTEQLTSAAPSWLHGAATCSARLCKVSDQRHSPQPQEHIQNLVDRILDVSQLRLPLAALLLKRLAERRPSARCSRIICPNKLSIQQEMSKRIYQSSSELKQFPLGQEADQTISTRPILKRCYLRFNIQDLKYIFAQIEKSTQFYLPKKA